MCWGRVSRGARGGEGHHDLISGAGALIGWGFHAHEHPAFAPRRVERPPWRVPASARTPMRTFPVRTRRRPARRPVGLPD